MKIRLAKKIMRCKTPYWKFRYLCYSHILLPGAGYKVDFKDHRITKAKDMVGRWFERKCINKAIKRVDKAIAYSIKHPFKINIQYS